MRDEVKNYLKMAEEYYKLAMELLARGDYYDAAEKIWASVKLITIALTQRYLKRVSPPKGVYQRNFLIEAFIKAGLSEEEAKSMAEYFIDVRDRLHGACFYGMIYEELEHRPLMEKARNYLDLVKRLLRVDEST